MPDGLSKMEQVRWKRAQRQQMQANPNVPVATGLDALQPSASASVQPTLSQPAPVLAAVAKPLSPPAPVQP
eukprot:COSAG01_NODE_55567_length_324_cov_0.693333_1_plen_70_part_10